MSSEFWSGLSTYKTALASIGNPGVHSLIVVTFSECSIHRVGTTRSGDAVDSGKQSVARHTEMQPSTVVITL